jgi:hypothetical protein
VCLIALEEEESMLVGLLGRVVLSSVVVPAVVDRIELAPCCTKCCIVVEDIVAEVVVGIGAALAVFVTGRRAVDGCRVVPGLSPCSIRLLP